MRTAAVALTLGWSDPMALLNLDPDRWQVAVAIITAAQEFAVKRSKSELDYQANATAAKVVPPLAKHLSGLVRALSRR